MANDFCTTGNSHAAGTGYKLINVKRTTWNFFSGNQLTFGSGSAGALAGVIHRREIKRVLVISDPALQNAGIVNHIETLIGQTPAEMQLFVDGEVEPSSDLATQVVDIANDFQPELFVAVGGGSNMDLAKASSAAFCTAIKVEDLFGFDNVPRPETNRTNTMLVCLPTTAGTGSEVSHSAILKNASTGKKAAILSQRIRPDTAIVDPRLTITCPAKVTAESGFDALTHAIEAFLVTNFYAFHENLSNGLPYEGNHPLGDLYAEKAITLIGANLERAVEEPDDLAARSAMSFAATLAGAAFSACGVSLAHALEYPIGSKYKCSHGAGNALVLPAVLRFWLPNRQARLAKIAGLLGVSEAKKMPAAEAAEAAIREVEKIRKAIGLPTSLVEVGGKSEDVTELAETAMSLQRLLDLSPRPVTPDEMERMLESCV